MIKYPYIGLGYGLISLVATTMYVCQREGGMMKRCGGGGLTLWSGGLIRSTLACSV